MPWRTSTVKEERLRFVLEADASDDSHAELCRRFNISRPTGYKWIERYKQEGIVGLHDRSHAPHGSPTATVPDVVEKILRIRKRRGWGGRKISAKLDRDPSVEDAPSPSTVTRVLKRNGCIESSKPDRRRSHPGPPLPIKPEPNATWSADFKGEFRMGDAKLCYPLTVQDGHSRFLLECRGMHGLDLQATKRRFRHLFREFGMPERIRTDNGHPFASRAIGRLSQLSVWWVSLGILPEFIEPASPHQNGRHERMHRTLKKRTASPPGPNLRAQQRRFNGFCRVYNFDRPHEALDMLTPSDVYRPSHRQLSNPRPPEYPGHFEIRQVSGDATLRWNNRKIFVSTTLKGHAVGLEEIGDGVWSVYFGPLRLGWLDEADYRIMDVKGRARRRR